MTEVKTYDASDLLIFDGNLGELQKRINHLVSKFGANAKIVYDAGYNNIQVDITYIENHQD